jgi:hypothetical protein
MSGDGVVFVAERLSRAEAGLLRVGVPRCEFGVVSRRVSVQNRQIS